MRLRVTILSIYLFPLFLLFSCEKKSSEDEFEHQQSSLDARQGAVMDTSNMDKIDDVFIMQAPGAQIDRDKVIAMLNEENLSFKDISNPNATPEDLEKSIEQLKELLKIERVVNDEELKFIVHTMLNSSYLQLFEHTKQDEHLDQAENHVDVAISTFKNQPEYKVDLADPYTGRVAVYSLRGDYEKAISQIKYLIEEYQEIGYGPYKNWFSANQVEWLYDVTTRDVLKEVEEQGIVNYLGKISDRYDNEVGLTAKMILAQHYATRGEQERVNGLIDSIEERLSSLDNQEFKEEKWSRYRTQIKSIQKREGQEVAKTDRDTLFYEITPEMIDQARIHEVDRNGNEYRVLVELKEEHHSDYAQKTTNNIGNFLAVVQNSEIISSSFPTIQTGISNGNFSLGPYEKQEEAKKVLRQVSGAEQ